jgi:hypothetical protein
MLDTNGIAHIHKTIDRSSPASIPAGEGGAESGPPTGLGVATVAASTVAAEKWKDGINWARYPKLASVFLHRPCENIYWHELVRLLSDFSARGPSVPITLSAEVVTPAIEARTNVFGVATTNDITSRVNYNAMDARNERRRVSVAGLLLLGLSLAAAVALTWGVLT